MSDLTMPGREARPTGVSLSVVPGAPAAPLAAVSWPAVFAGAVVAAALSLILLVLGTGLGLSSISPFTGKGASARTFGASTIAWLTFAQLAASALGGYLAGRLRTRWVSTHADEVYFRDTAHGVLAWAVASLATAALLTSVIAAIVGAGATGAGTAAGDAATAATHAVAPAAESTAKGAGSDTGNQYFVDKLFRQEAAASPGAASAPGVETGTSDAELFSAEVARIFASALETGGLSAKDARYLAQVVSQRTGLSPSDAQKRVSEIFASLKAKADQVKAQAQDAAETARKASAYASLWLFVALLVGAFVASLAATFGGRQRDLV